MIPDKKEDGYIYSIFLARSESETNILRYMNIHLQEPLQKPYHIQLMELRAMENPTNGRVAPRIPTHYKLIIFCR